MSLMLISDTMDASSFPRPLEEFWSWPPSEWPSIEAPPHPARMKITRIRRTKRSTFCATNGLGVRIRVCSRSRCRQFTAESTGSLGYALWSVIELFYEAGTLVATGASSGLPEPFVWDGRTRQWRAPASAYRETVLDLRAQGIPHEDRASAFQKI